MKSGIPKSTRFSSPARLSGAEGYIYPYPLYDVLTEKQVEKDYNVLNLKNEYVDISVLPEIGGRIFAATDKTNGYHFFYTQTGVKPALIGMLGCLAFGRCGMEYPGPSSRDHIPAKPIGKCKRTPMVARRFGWARPELRHRLKWSVGVSVYPQPFRG